MPLPKTLFLFIFWGLSILYSCTHSEKNLGLVFKTKDPTHGPEPLHLEAYDTVNLNLKFIEFSEVSIKENKVLLISTSPMNFDYFKWQSCKNDGKCVSGFSSRQSTHLVDLPEGKQTISVELCIHKDHNKAQIESCTATKTYVYDQTPRKDPDLKKWMAQNEYISQRYNKLGIRLYQDLIKFLDTTTECFDDNNEVAYRSKVAITYGPDILGTQLENLLDPLPENIKSSGTLLFEHEDAQIEKESGIPLTDGSDDIDQLQGFAEILKNLNEEKAKINYLETSIAKENQNINKKLSQIEELTKIIKSHLNIRTELANTFSNYVGTKKSKDSWQRLVGNEQNRHPKRISYLQATEFKELTQRAFGDNPQNIQNSMLQDNTLSTLLKTIAKIKAELNHDNWLKYKNVESKKVTVKKAPSKKMTTKKTSKKSIKVAENPEQEWTNSPEFKIQQKITNLENTIKFLEDLYQKDVLSGEKHYKIKLTDIPVEISKLTGQIKESRQHIPVLQSQIPEPTKQRDELIGYLEKEKAKLLAGSITGSSLNMGNNVPDTLKKYFKKPLSFRQNFITSQKTKQSISPLIISSLTTAVKLASAPSETCSNNKAIKSLQDRYASIHEEARLLYEERQVAQDFILSCLNR